MFSIVVLISVVKTVSICDNHVNQNLQSKVAIKGGNIRLLNCFKSKVNNRCQYYSSNACGFVKIFLIDWCLPN